MAQVAARFGVPVSEKVMAQSVPVIGAAGGAAINVVFINHFQDLARGHFIVRRLERKYDPETVKKTSLDRQLAQIAAAHPVATRLQTIPGVGVLTATALIGAVSHIHAFRRGREFASWLTNPTLLRITQVLVRPPRQRLRSSREGLTD
jgi:hypothetical protein